MKQNMSEYSESVEYSAGIEYSTKVECSTHAEISDLIHNRIRFTLALLNLTINTKIIFSKTQLFRRSSRFFNLKFIISQETFFWQ